MKKFYLIILALFTSSIFSQVVINEVDADVVGTDNKEFIELKSSTPNFSLNGYVLVFFNGTSAGTGNASYFSLDLDGLTTDVNGNILIGNALVSPTPALIIVNNIIQNGPDGIGLYLGNDTDFPIGTLANTTNLIDSIAYSFSFVAIPTLLMSSFGTTTFVNEAMNTNAPGESMQRKADGTFEAKTPTPGVNNDGTGIVLIYVSTSVNSSTLNEGQNLIISCSSSQAIVGNPLVLSFTLNNGSFNSIDFSGTTNVTIPVGSTTSSRTISILNDGINEGDEEAKLTLSSPDVTYNLNNNNIIIRINDANFTTLPFGTPASPTYGTVFNTKPTGYYDSLNGLSGVALKQEIQNIIANPSIVREHNYADVYTILRDADQNPANSSQVWLMYVEQSRSKLDQQVGSSNIGFWNREHIYPQSRGGFNLDSNVFPDGINIFTTTDANDIEAGGTDAHHLRAEDGPENSLRNNRNYGAADYSGPTGNQGTWKGDVARALFYMAVRYNNLNIVNGYPPENPDGFIGDLATLLTWNNLDPADDFEMNRNNIIYNWQKNRNPFIDMPNLASYIFGNNVGQPWSNSLSVLNSDIELQVKMYPNPATNFVTIDGLTNESNVEIFNSIGEKVYVNKLYANEKLNFNLSSGIYLVKIISENKSTVKKLIVE
jgi:Endonuclease I/Secretion system C-terminal sorting domain